jgi:ribonuclease HI
MHIKFVALEIHLVFFQENKMSGKIKLIHPTPIKKKLTKKIGNLFIVYTDGSCLNNGKKNAMAGVGVFWNVNDPYNISEPLPGDVQTNQRAELFAVQRALEIYESAKMNGGKLEIRTDSKYSIDCSTTWLDNWKRNGWKTSKGEPVQNKDLIMSIDKIRNRIGAQKIIWTHVKAHCGNTGNEHADALAKAGSLKHT